MGERTQSTWQRVLLDNWQRRGSLAWLLWPISFVFGVLVRLRQGLYLSGMLPRHRLDIPVIVVGNVVAGGAGKTPVVIALVRHLQAQGRRPGVVSRGYGRADHDCREITATTPASQAGDEPLLIHRSTGVPVVVAPRRVDAARALLHNHPDTDVLISDDGLQHLALARDIEICVFDDRGTGNGWLLPAGPLREPWPRYVDLVLHSGNRPAFTGHSAQRALASAALRADGSRIALSDLAAQGRPLLALAGIARPESFFDMLRERGLPLAVCLPLPDHFDFSDWRLPQEPDYIVLCTEKDAVKLWPRFPEALAVPLTLFPEAGFFDAFDRLLHDAREARLSSPHGHTTP